MRSTTISALLGTSILLAGCTTIEQSRSLPIAQTTASASPYQGIRSPVAIGKFDNRSSYMRGLFSDGIDRLGGQAKTILITHLQKTGRFAVLDRDNMTEISQEANLGRQTQSLKGAAYVITGDVSEFGRKEVGDRQLFGILGRGKSQIAYAKINLNIVDVTTSQVVHSAQGAGEHSLANREIAGFGSTASYDSTLNGKVLDLAIREAINNLVGDIDSGAWHPRQQ